MLVLFILLAEVTLLIKFLKKVWYFAFVLVISVIALN